MTLIGPSGPVAISKLYNFTQLQPAFWVNIGSVVHDPSQALWRLTSSRTQTQVDNHRQLIMDMGFSDCLFIYSWSCCGEWRSVCYGCSSNPVNSAGGLRFRLLIVHSCCKYPRIYASMCTAIMRSHKSVPNCEALEMFKCFMPCSDLTQSTIWKMKVLYWQQWFHEESFTYMQPFHSTKDSL